MSLADLPKKKYFNNVLIETKHKAKTKSQPNEESERKTKIKSQKKKKNQIEKSQKIKNRVGLKKFEQENFETKELINICSDFNTHRKLLHSKYQAEIITNIMKQIAKLKDPETVLDALKLIHNNIVGLNAVTKHVLDSAINKIFLNHLQKISPDYSKFEKKFNDIINIDINNNVKTKAFKRKFKNFFYELDGSQETSLLRLSNNPAFFTDPDGIDPIELLSSDIKLEYFGQFLQGEIVTEYNPEDSGSKSRADWMLKPPSAWNKLDDDPYFSFERLGFSYERAAISIFHHAENNSIEMSISILPKKYSNHQKLQTIRIILRDRNLDGLNYPKIQIPYQAVRPVDQDVFDDTLLPGKWRYHHRKNFTEKPLLAVDIKSQNEGEKCFKELPEEYKNTHIRDSFYRFGGFIKDPLYQLINNIDDTNSSSAEASKKFVLQWEHLWKKFQSFKNKDTNNDLNFIPFPGEPYAPLPKVSKDILGETFKKAIEHGYDGISCDPSYFHVAHHLKRMGFKFDNAKDEATYRDIQNSLMTIESRLQRQAFDDNFFKIYAQKRKEMDDEAAKQEATEEAEKIAREIFLTPQEKSWIVVLNHCEDKTLIPEGYRLYKVDKNGDKVMDENEKPTFLSWPTTSEHFVWMTLSKEAITEWTTDEKGEKIGDDLIVDNTVTGYTHLSSPENKNQPSQLESLINDIIHKSEFDTTAKETTETEKSQESVVVYHMYANNTDKHNYSKHVEIIKKALAEFGVEIYEEKNILGNVKNPGPNRPFGWEPDEAAYVENGIEKSQQAILVIKCQDVKKLKSVLEWLNTYAWKKEETDLLPIETDQSIDGSWFVPDIQVFNIGEDFFNGLNETTKTYFKPATLNIKQCSGGKIFTITSKGYEPLAGYKAIDIFIHKAMYGLIKEQEEREGEQQIYSR